MSDLINREPIIEWLKTAGHFLKMWHGRKNNDTLKVIGYIINHIEAEPTVDAVPVKRGKWILHKNGDATCDQCHRWQKDIWDFDNWQNFCGHCGARMDGEQYAVD